MQDIVLVLSRCLRPKNRTDRAKNYYRFHFIGFYNGLKIREIHVYPYQEVEIHVGSDYLLWVSLKEVQASILVASLIKLKKID